MKAKTERSDPMKKKNERNARKEEARKEEARKELKPEVQDGVKLTDEQMAQVTGGAGSDFELDFEIEAHVGVIPIGK